MSKGQAIVKGSLAAAEAAAGAFRGLRKFWGSMSSTGKQAVATSALSFLAGMGVSTLSGSDPKTPEGQTQIMTEFADYWAHADASNPSELLNALGDLIASAGPNARALYDAMIGSVADLKQRGVLEYAWARALSRASATAHTGDGAAVAVTDATAAYDQMVANMAVVKQAAALLRLYNPADLQIIRDAMFMDQQAFAAVVSRI